MMRKYTKFIILIIAAATGVFLIWKFNIGSKSFLVESQKTGQEEQQDTQDKTKEAPLYPGSLISGVPCENYNRRPLAVMIAEDSVARPLSGISEADLVVEMPVVTGSITRMMAVFQCQSPAEIGSVRSARHDFIPLAMGLDAIFAHWGGSHYALDELDAKIMDNIDAMPNPFDAFYRKYSLSPPHNGFVSVDRLVSAAKKLSYRLESNFEGYPHVEPSAISHQLSAILKIGYPYPYNVMYEYNSETGSYLRWRGGKKEVDRNNNEQVEAKNVVVMRADSRQIEKDYNDVDVEGEGEAVVYRNGEEIKGRWKKDPADKFSKLYFYNEDGEEIKFVSGSVWVEIIEPGKLVKYETANSGR